MNLYIAGLVIFLTALVSMLGTAWWTGRGCVATEQPQERKRSGGNENADRWREPLSRAGYLPGPSFAGAQDPAYQVPGPIPWDLAGAAYQLGQMRASQDDITRQVDAIMAEVEAHPERWQR